MQITSPKVRLHSTQIHLDHADPVRSIHDTQHAEFPTRLDELFPREPNPRHTHHGIEHRCLDGQTLFLLDFFHESCEPIHDVIMRNGQVVLHLPELDRGALGQREEAIFDRSVDGIEVDDDVGGSKRDVVEDGGDGGGGILGEGEGGGGDVEERGQLRQRFAAEGGRGPADEEVGARFGQGLVRLQGRADGEGIRAVGSWWGS